MDLIREQLLYKQKSLTICLENLSTQEHYECIRILLASRKKDVSICLHSVTNPYILTLTKKLVVPIIDCRVESEKLPRFDRLKVDSYPDE